MCGRFVSAYSSQCASKPQPRTCNDAFHGGRGIVIPFQATIEGIRHSPIMTPQWLWQSRFCGLQYSIQHYNFVEELTGDNVGEVREKVKLMFQNANIKLSQESNKILDEVFPHKIDNWDMWKSTNFRKNAKSQVTGSAGKTKKYFEGNPAGLRTVIDYYRDDYSMFGIKLHTWERSALFGNAANETKY